MLCALLAARALWEAGGPLPLPAPAPAGGPGGGGAAQAGSPRGEDGDESLCAFAEGRARRGRGSLNRPFSALLAMLRS